MRQMAHYWDVRIPSKQGMRKPSVDWATIPKVVFLCYSISPHNTWNPQIMSLEHPQDPRSIVGIWYPQNSSISSSLDTDCHSRIHLQTQLPYPLIPCHLKSYGSIPFTFKEVQMPKLAENPMTQLPHPE